MIPREAPMAHKLRRMNLEKLIADGEGNGPNGFCAQTPNGTAYWKGTGHNREDYRFDWPEARPGGPWPEGRSNRTGE